MPALTHYVGIAGVGAHAADLPANDPRAGFFGYSRTIKLQDITDGTSYTLVAIETASDNGPWAAGGAATVRGLDPANQPYIGNGRQFGLIHFAGTILVRPSAGANAALADGSVRFLSASISAPTLEALATFGGGDRVGDIF
jgi:hypothetical protein